MSNLWHIERQKDQQTDQQTDQQKERLLRTPSGKPWVQNIIIRKDMILQEIQKVSR